jgi:glycosyltransferase involved in cell wall biosynthesis
MSKILFLHHPFHSRTGSHIFFMEALRQNASVDSFEWDEFLKKDRSRRVRNLVEVIQKNKYDIIIFWQVEPLIEVSKDFRTIFVPMYDSVANRNAIYFMHHANSQYLNFSLNLHRYCLRLGLNSTYLRFYPKPVKKIDSESKVNDSGDKRIFFWERRPDTNINLLQLCKKLPRNQNFIIHYRRAADLEKLRLQNRLLPEFNNIKIQEITSDWLEKDEYLSFVKNSDYFVAPRMTEGIGMSFLEALQFGIPVIGHDAPTLNEYVEHGVNGFLGDFNSEDPLKMKEETRLSTKEIANRITVGNASFQESLDKYCRYIFTDESWHRSEKHLNIYSKFSKSFFLHLFAVVDTPSLNIDKTASFRHFLAFLRIIKSKLKQRFRRFIIARLDRYGF